MKSFYGIRILPVISASASGSLDKLSPRQDVLDWLSRALLLILLLVQIPLLWFFFWCCVYAEHMGTKVAMTVAWYTWIMVYRHCRRLLCKFLSMEALAVVCLDHGEMAVGVCTVMSVLANVTSYLHRPGPRLYDLGFSALPEIPHNSPYNCISDILTALPVLLLLPYTILYLDRTRRYQCWIDFFRLIVVIYTIRSITMILTSLPGPADIVLRLGPLYGDYRTCGDLLFSGHAAFLTVSLCLWRKQNRWCRTSNVCKVLFPLYLLLMSSLAVAGRKHYTVDLALGIVIGYLSFSRFSNGWGFKGVDELEPVKTQKEDEEEALLVVKGGSQLPNGRAALAEEASLV